MFDQDIQRNFDSVPSRPGPIDPEPNFRPPPEPEPPISQPDPSPNLRRSTRTRKAPERYTFDKAHGYWNAKTIAKSIFKALIFAPASQYDFRFIHALLLDSSTGTLSNVVPNCPDTFRPLFGLKSKVHDPDTPNMGEAMTGPYREKFLAAMRQEIEELEGHKTWKVLKRSSLPEGANILPSTWAFKIKRYPDGRLRKFKARFCVRGDMQIEGVDYGDKYAPVVAWSTVRTMMRISLKENWKSRQVDFANAFVQADLKEDVYITMPPGFSCPD